MKRPVRCGVREDKNRWESSLLARFIGWVDCQVYVCVWIYAYVARAYVRMYVSYVRSILDLNPDPDSPLIPIGSWTSRARLTDDVQTASTWRVRKLLHVHLQLWRPVVPARRGAVLWESSRSTTPIGRTPLRRKTFVFWAWSWLWIVRLLLLRESAGGGGVRENVPRWLSGGGNIHRNTCYPMSYICLPNFLIRDRETSSLTFSKFFSLWRKQFFTSWFLINHWRDFRNGYKSEMEKKVNIYDIIYQ